MSRGRALLTSVGTLLRAGADAIGLCPYPARRGRTVMGLLLLVLLAAGGARTAAGGAVAAPPRCEQHDWIARCVHDVRRPVRAVDRRSRPARVAARAPRALPRWLDLRRGGLPSPRAPDAR